MEGIPGSNPIPQEYAADYLARLKKLNEEITAMEEFLANIGKEGISRSPAEDAAAIRVAGRRLRQATEERNRLLAENERELTRHFRNPEDRQQAA